MADQLISLLLPRRERRVSLHFVHDGAFDFACAQTAAMTVILCTGVVLVSVQTIRGEFRSSVAHVQYDSPRLRWPVLCARNVAVLGVYRDVAALAKVRFLAFRDGLFRSRCRLYERDIEHRCRGAIAPAELLST